MNLNDWEAVNRIPGYMSKVECEWLAEMACKASSWTELGAYCGRSMLCVGLALPAKASLRVVDLYLGSIRRAGQSLLTTYEELVQRRPDLKIILVRMESDQAASVLADSDVVFLDAAHDAEHVKRDIRAWTSKCSVLCGHDYNVPAWPGVKQAVDQELTHISLPAGTIWLRG